MSWHFDALFRCLPEPLRFSQFLYPYHQYQAHQWIAVPLDKLCILSQYTYLRYLFSTIVTLLAIWGYGQIPHRHAFKCTSFLRRN